MNKTLGTIVLSVAVAIFAMNLISAESSCSWPTTEDSGYDQVEMAQSNELMNWVWEEVDYGIENRILCFDGTWYVSETRDAEDIDVYKNSSDNPEGYIVSYEGDEMGDWTIYNGRWTQNAALAIPDNADGYWPANSLNYEELITNFQTNQYEYIGWAYNDELANITYFGDNESEMANYIDERLLYYNGSWRSTTNDWPYYELNENRTWGIIVEDIGTVLGNWISTEDDYFGAKWVLTDDNQNDTDDDQNDTDDDYEDTNYVSHHYGNPLVFYDYKDNSHDELGSTPDVIINNGERDTSAVSLIRYIPSGSESGVVNNVKTTSVWQWNIWTIGLIVLVMLILIVFIIIVFLLG